MPNDINGRVFTPTGGNFQPEGNIPAPTMEHGYTPQKIGKDQLLEFLRVLQKYKAGKAHLEDRIIRSEEWWKLRNAGMEFPHGIKGYKSQSGWLHNVIASKHADAMDSFPAPVVLAREESDKGEAKMLTSIIPCVLEANQFDSVYADAMWDKLKYGTAVYKITWDSGKYNGLGDISVEKTNLLNIFWEPGITDIQQSRYVFHTELRQKDLLEAEYPQLRGMSVGNVFTANKFLYDDSVDTTDQLTVIDCYYKQNGKLHYVKFVNDIVLFATENDLQYADAGLYDHGMYPYVFDALYPVEGSPCGYGYVDICKNPQMEIDLLKTSIVHNAMAGATPRHFVRMDGNVNEEEYLDVTKPLVHVQGNLGEESIRPIPHASLDGIYVSVLQETINELRETSSNTEAATGAGTSGATAASAIAALQEASGKTSRDSTQASYRSFRKIVTFCIELIRQFYDIPRQFRIVGERGAQEYMQYSNAGIVPQYQGNSFGQDMGFRLPVFDIKVEAEKKSAYTTISQNELALQFFQMGFFNPAASDQALACIRMMSFEGKAEMEQMISQNGQLFQQLQAMTQYAATLAHQYGDTAALQQIAQVSAQIGGGAPMMGGAPEDISLSEDAGESSVTRNARERANSASQPRTE